MFSPRVGSVAIAFGLSLTVLQAQMILLPQWNETDWKMREFVVPELGGALFPGTIYSPEPAPANLADDGLEETPVEPDIITLEAVQDLPASLVSTYIPEKRPNVHLLDPQELMTQSRRDGVLHFLDYHCREARSAIHIFILKPNQRIPSQIDLNAVHRSWFGDSLGVMVIYNFGNPGMSRLVFGDEVGRRVSEARRSSACVDSINEAIVAANAEVQLERFLTELSRRLYWIEEVFYGEQAFETDPVVAETHELASMPLSPSRKPRVLLTVLTVTALLASVTIGIISLQRHASKKTYYFPNRRIHPRLGGRYGGGNRLVVTFDERRE